MVHGKLGLYAVHVQPICCYCFISKEPHNESPGLTSCRPFKVPRFIKAALNQDFDFFPTNA